MNPFKDHHFIGIDPDLHTTALAIVNGLGEAVHFHVFKSKDSTGRDAVVDMCRTLQIEFPNIYPMGLTQAVAIESQEIVYSARSGVNPRDLLLLANISGACLGVCCLQVPMYLPAPQQWKGQVPKNIHQARIYSRMGWQYSRAGGKSPYMYPLEHVLPDNIQQLKFNKGDWKHLGDALGLALWARDKYYKEN